MAYFIMVDDEIENDLGEARYEIENFFKIDGVVSWEGGRKIDKPIDHVIEIEYTTYETITGPPVDLIDEGIPIMSKRLAHALQQGGVDNLQLYPAILKKSDGSESHDYYAFNVVGLVAAADLGLSDWESFDGRLNDVSFYSLSLDELKIRGLLLFRLAENINALVVHEKLRDMAVAAGVPAANFIQPDDWAQI